MFTAGPLAIELERKNPQKPSALWPAARERPRSDRDNSGAVV